MQTVTIQIKNKKAYSLLRGLEKVNLIKVVKEPALSPYKKKIAKSLRNALKEVKQFEQGKVKLKDAKDLMNEL